MKHINKVRTKEQQCVRRVIYFDDVISMAKFVNLYKEMFYESKDRPDKFSCMETSYDVEYGAYTLAFTINKEKWDYIVNDCDLEKVIGSYRNTQWKCVSA